MKTRILLLVLLMFALSSCQKEKSIKFTLYLNFIASTPECKTFNISIDNQIKLNDELCYQGSTPCFKVIEFQIETGSHIIKAEANTSEAFHQIVDFSTEKTYGYLDYHQKTSKFSLSLSSTGGID